jgi:membrane protein required for colicin V production|tara:strand:+ start:6000 stop:6632 length:633 start_codon:yes stop_codon:yes gene_type:complete
MNFIDIVLLVPLAYAAWKGFKKGFIIEIFTLLAFFVGIYAGVHFSDYASEKLSTSFEADSPYLSPAAFTITFLVIGAIVFFAGKAIEQVVKITALSPMNKMGGLVFGAIKMLLILSVLLSVVESYSEKNDLISQESRDDSMLYKPVKAVGLYTVPGLRTSTIFIENALKPESDSTGLTVQQVFRAKEIADSLGMEPKDAIELYDIYKKYE